MSRHNQQVHGVTITLVRLDRACDTVKTFRFGRRIWVLLKDGRVGVDDRNLFKWAWTDEKAQDTAIAEPLWRLGKISKGQYDKIAAAHNKKREQQGRRYAASELKDAAKRLGIKLTVAQLRAAA